MGRQLLSLVVFTTMARILDPAAFGLVSLIAVYLMFVTVFSDQGLGAAVIQRKDLTKEHMDAAFWTNFTVSSVLCVATMVLAGTVAKMLGNPQVVPLLRVASLGLVINAMSAIHANLLVKAMDFRSPTLRNLIAYAVGGVVGVTLALLGFGVWALVLQQLTAEAAGAVFLWSVSKYRPSFRFSYRHFRELSDVSWSILFTSMMWFFTTRLDQMVIGRFIGIEQLGLYVVGNKLPDMAKTITHSPLENISLPAFANLQDQQEKLCATIYKGVHLTATISFAVFVGMACVATNLIPFLFGAKWVHAETISILLCLFALVNVLQVFFHPSFLASGATKEYIFVNIANATCMVVSCLVGVKFGINMLIVSMITTNSLMAFPQMAVLKRRIGLRAVQYMKPCLVPLLAAGVMALVLLLVSHLLPVDVRNGVAVAVKIPAGAVAYVGSIFILDRSSLINIWDAVLHALGKK